MLDEFTHQADGDRTWPNLVVRLDVDPFGKSPPQVKATARYQVASALATVAGAITD